MKLSAPNRHPSHRKALLFTAGFSTDRKPVLLKAERLDLIPASQGLARADLAGRTVLEELLRVKVPNDWPPELFDDAVIRYTISKLDESPEHLGWWYYYLIRRATQSCPGVLIGVAGYKGPPNRTGGIEIGYSVLPEFRRKGYATEAAHCLIKHGFSFKQVNYVVAETHPSLTASIRVLEKCGFTRIATSSEERILHFVLSRNQTGFSCWE